MERLAQLLDACYTAKVLRSGAGYSEALVALRDALKTDGDLLAYARRRRSAMQGDVMQRDYVSRIAAPILDEALNGLGEDGANSTTTIGTNL